MSEGMLYNLTSPEFEVSQVVNTTYLYYLGDECTDLTGGWGFCDFSWESAHPSSSKNSNNLQINVPSGNGQRGGWMPNNKFDFSQFSQMSARVNLDTYCGGGLAGVKNKVRGEGVYYEINIVGDSYVRYTFDGILQGPIANNEQLFPNVFIGGANGRAGVINIYAVMLSKQDDISGLSAYGSTISGIITNATSLLADKSAVKYMINYCTGDFMWTALSTASFITALNASPHKNTILANVEWAKALSLVL